MLKRKIIILISVIQLVIYSSVILSDTRLKRAPRYNENIKKRQVLIIALFPEKNIYDKLRSVNERLENFFENINYKVKEKWISYNKESDALKDVPLYETDDRLGDWQLDILEDMYAGGNNRYYALLHSIWPTEIPDKDFSDLKNSLPQNVIDSINNSIEARRVCNIVDVIQKIKMSRDYGIFILQTHRMQMILQI